MHNNDCFTYVMDLFFGGIAAEIDKSTPIIPSEDRCPEKLYTA
jgi:hypothetical protein